MISTGRPHHITVLRLPRPTAWLYKSSGVACSGVTSSLVLAHTQVFRGAHQATSKLGPSPFPASSLRTIWLLRKVVFNMQPTALTKPPFPFGGSWRRWMRSFCSLGDRDACAVIPASELLPESRMQVFPNVQQSVPGSAVV